LGSDRQPLITNKKANDVQGPVLCKDKKVVLTIFAQTISSAGDSFESVSEFKHKVTHQAMLEFQQRVQDLLNCSQSCFRK
jgi:hypothetical protein